VSGLLVIGFGVTGRALARHLGPVTVVDDRPADDADAAAAALGATLVRAPDEPRLAALVAAADVVVVSPGVPVRHPVYRLAEASATPLRSELELGWQRLAARPRPRPDVLAVTGTNGKTTVTTLVTALLAAGGARPAAAGNIGTPLIDLVDEDLEWIVTEVSSFQLRFTEGWHPRVSGWLNLSPDHLDWHPDLDDYAASKARIWANQGPGDTVVVNADDPAVASRAAESVSDRVELVTWSTAARAATDRPTTYAVVDGRLCERGRPVMALDELARSLPHDVANALAALALARAAGATLDACCEVLATAPVLPHRVAAVAEVDGVAWYDDSKATTPASVLAAVAGFSSVVLIAGGHNKGLDLGALSAAVPPVHAAVAIGDAAGEVVAALEDLVPTVEAATMTEAVARAAELARPGDAVILSPGCASFDWYRSYGERGDDFAGRVLDLAALRPGGGRSPRTTDPTGGVRPC
jgi:UDP-N-acetylmuramoylalanine--D-glutamate ligase